MTANDRAEFWWTNITGASAFVSSVADALTENRLVVLRVPEDLPWRHEMRSRVQSLYRERVDSTDCLIDELDMEDENPENRDPGRFLLERFATKPAVSGGYREKSSVTIQEYLRKNGVLKKRIVWIKGMNDDAEAQWVNFCTGYVPDGAEAGNIVLELRGPVSFKARKHMSVIQYSEYVSRHDVQLFNSFLLNGEAKRRTEFSDMLREYIAVVSAGLCGTDAELSAYVTDEVDFRTEDPVSGMMRIAESNAFEQRGRGRDSVHVLRLARSGNREAIARRVWAAQIQCLFPIVERARIEIIERWRESIQDVLDRREIEQYKEILTDPLEAELGTLTYMMTLRDNRGEYLLYLPDQAERDRIQFLHECRNRLAHAETCSPEQVLGLLRLAGS